MRAWRLYGRHASAAMGGGAWRAGFFSRADCHFGAPFVAKYRFSRGWPTSDFGRCGFEGGRYFDSGNRPRKGLAVARMAAHITYLSEAALQRKFGRNLQDREEVTYGFDADFQIESYLRHQGMSFVERFDANSYLYITRAMDYFDIAAENGGNLAAAFKNSDTRFCVMSFTSDWLFPTSESITLVRALNAAGANVSFVEIESDKGHDAFLLDEPEMHATLSGFLASAARRGWHDD